MAMPLLGTGREFDRIRAVLATLGASVEGAGDDCAFVPSGPGVIALSTDTSVEGVHFRREWLSLEEIGWRAAAGALSDLAAVAADPIGVLAALVLPDDLGEAETVRMMRGIGDAAASVGGKVLGGDMSRGPSLSLGITVVGFCAAPVRRTGAAIGDSLWVTGSLGGAAAALLSLEAGAAPAPAARAVFAHPEPRVPSARWLAGRGARAMIDLSDGLAGDAGHLAAASGVRLRIDIGGLPVHPDLVSRVARTGESAVALAAIGGEDYELLVAMPPGFDETDAAEHLHDTGVRLTRIGVVEGGQGVSLTEGGVSVTLRSFDHFR
jgi:thiamine-monophosphate kinase